MAAGRFPKGKSGNPGGRPKANHDVQALARVHTAAAIEALVLSLADKKTRVQASVALLNRGWGTPPQTVGGDPDKPFKIQVGWED